MALDTRIKQAAINTALRHQLKNISSNKERVCRNLIDFGMQLSSHKVTYEEQSRLYQELFTLLSANHHPAANLESIRNWMFSTFL